VIRRATIVAVGRPRGWTAEGCDDYLTRLRRYFPVEVVEVPEEDMNRRTAEEVLAAEAQRLLKRLPDRAHVVALDRERGKSLSSEDLATGRAYTQPDPIYGRQIWEYLPGGPAYKQPC
jgi:23S rRNA (pseudouridine1915-N3)-methyltransferase